MSRNFYKLQVVAAVILIVVWISCKGVGPGAGGTSDSATSSVRSFRLGVAEDATGPVATTAAMDNGESIIVLTPDANAKQIAYVLYAVNDRVLRMTVDANYRPSAANTVDMESSFSSYTNSSVQIHLVYIGSDDQQQDLGTVTVGLPASLLPAGVTLKDEGVVTFSDLDRRSLTILALAANAINTYGCSGTASLLSLNVPATRWSELAMVACGSPLVEEIIRRFLGNEGLGGVPFATFSFLESCNFPRPGWESNFQNASDCALGILNESFFADNSGSGSGGNASGGFTASGGTGGGTSGGFTASGGNNNGEGAGTGGVGGSSVGGSGVDGGGSTGIIVGTASSGTTFGISSSGFTTGTSSGTATGSTTLGTASSGSATGTNTGSAAGTNTGSSTGTGSGTANTGSSTGTGTSSGADTGSSTGTGSGSGTASSSSTSTSGMVPVPPNTGGSSSVTGGSSGSPTTTTGGSSSVTGSSSAGAFP